MADSDSDDWIKTEERSDDFDDGLGEDWESAFQAEDFMFSPGEGEGGDFFLETTGPSTAYEFTPPDDGDLAGVPDLDQGAGKTAPAEPGEPTTATDERGAAPLLAERWRRLRANFFALPWIHRLALGGTTLLIALLGLVLLLPGRQAAGPDVGAPAGGSPDLEPAVAGEPGPAENVRRKWELAPFVLPVADAAEKQAFLEVDLSLILVLPDGEVPTDKKLFVRDLIYRYYRQQPLATLRRFALARGEMNRTLLAWLREHWPEAPVETVVFTRYQLT